MLVAFASVAVIGFAISTLHPTSAPQLRAKVLTRSEDIGIPGITKMYEATLTSRGLLPVSITRCDFIDDTGSPGTMVAYAVQRWNESRKQWDTIVEFGKSQFCKPYPLGIVKAELVNRWLWPCQSLSTGEEATAAREGFARGDRARFVIFVRAAGDYDSSVATADFIIDEHQRTDVKTCASGINPPLLPETVALVERNLPKS
jgi:hypothetical protein